MGLFVGCRGLGVGADPIELDAALNFRVGSSVGFALQHPPHRRGRDVAGGSPDLDAIEFQRHILGAPDSLVDVPVGQLHAGRVDVLASGRAGVVDEPGRV